MNYPSPVLDGIARRAIARLSLAGARGMTVTALAVAIEANRSTVGNVLRGAAVSYGAAPFVRAGRQGQSLLWRARDKGGES